VKILTKYADKNKLIMQNRGHKYELHCEKYRVHSFHGDF
jgi:hypothetical protein